MNFDTNTPAGGAVLPASTPAGELVCVAESDPDWRLANIRRSFLADRPRFHRLPEYRKPKDRPVAIVGGAPSLLDYLDTLRGFDAVIACGTAHDFLIENGIRPRYAVIFDPAPHHVKSLTRPSGGCTYLVASSAASQIFDVLRASACVVWHAEDPEIPAEAYQGEPSVEGGPTALCRAVALSLLLGFRDLHLFGADSSYASATHAYASYDPPPDVVTVQVGGDGGPTFQTSLAMVAQAQALVQHVNMVRLIATIAVHCDGLFPELFRRSLGSAG